MLWVMIVISGIYFSFFSRGFSFFFAKRKKRLTGCSPRLSYSGMLFGYFLDYVIIR